MKSNILNVLDLELSCYPNDSFPAGERKEIIEFGLTTVDLSKLTIVQSFSFPIIPTMSTISPYCTELTGWTEAKLKRQGMSFAEALRRIEGKHGGKNRTVVTDSDKELDAVRDQCQLMGLPCPFGSGYFNVSTMIAVLTGELRNLSLPEKLALFKLEFEGALHSGKDDSRNIARLFLAVATKGRIELAGSL
ncbi:MAG: 3'-5' exonuclease [Candidatus Melainabacteria bacterium]|nr:3'-5' exonuclease [Candidatus Melainabacteria bacterium]